MESRKIDDSEALKTAPEDEAIEQDQQGDQASSEADEELKRLQQEVALLKSSLSIKDSVIESLKKKNSHFEEKIAEFREFVKKMEEEVQAVRARADRDLLKQVDQSKIDFFQSFLNIVDSFDRSLSSLSPDDPSFEGSQLIRKQIDELLAKQEIQKIPATGTAFDPEIHEALTTIPVQDDEQDGKVIEEVTPGYFFKEKVLRAAQVVVGQS